MQILDVSIEKHEQMERKPPIRSDLISPGGLTSMRLHALNRRVFNITPRKGKMVLCHFQVIGNIFGSDYPFSGSSVKVFRFSSIKRRKEARETEGNGGRKRERKRSHEMRNWQWLANRMDAHATLRLPFLFFLLVLSRHFGWSTQVFYWFYASHATRRQWESFNDVRYDILALAVFLHVASWKSIWMTIDSISIGMSAAARSSKRSVDCKTNEKSEEKKQYFHFVRLFILMSTDWFWKWIYSPKVSIEARNWRKSLFGLPCERCWSCPTPPVPGASVNNYYLRIESVIYRIEKTRTRTEVSFVCTLFRTVLGFSFRMASTWCSG